MRKPDRKLDSTLTRSDDIVESGTELRLAILELVENVRSKVLLEQRMAVLPILKFLIRLFDALYRERVILVLLRVGHVKLSILKRIVVHFSRIIERLHGKPFVNSEIHT